MPVPSVQPQNKDSAKLLDKLCSDNNKVIDYILVAKNRVANIQSAKLQDSVDRALQASRFARNLPIYATRS